MEAEESIKKAFRNQRGMSQMPNNIKGFLENDGSGSLGALSRQRGTYNGKQQEE